MVRSTLSLAGKVVWRALAAGVVVTTLTILLTAMMQPAHKDVITEKVAEAIANDVIPSQTTWNDALFNECLILSSLVLDYPSKLIESLTLRTFYCDDLRSYFQGEPIEADFYNRYLNGWRVYYWMVLQFASVKTSFLITQVVGIIIILIGLTIQILKLNSLARLQSDNSVCKVESIGFIAIFLSLLLFYGWDRYGDRPTFALPALFLFGILVWLSLRRAFSVGLERLCTVFALFGAITAQVDFLTGAAPLALATSVGVLGLQIRHPRSDARALLAAGTSYVGGFVAAFVVKYGLMYILLGSSFFERNLQALAYRLAGNYLDEIDIDLLDQLVPNWSYYLEFPFMPVVFLIAKLMYSADSIGLGSRIIGISVIISSFLVIGLQLCRIRSLSAAVNWWQSATMMLSVLIIVVWYAVFFQHSVVHTKFMVRLLVWPIAVAMFFIGTYVLRKTKPWRSVDGRRTPV